MTSNTQLQEIVEASTLKLDKEDSLAFAKSLLEEPRDNPKLREALANAKQLMEG